MFGNSFQKIFGGPRRAFGVDIADGIVKFVELENGSGGLRLSKYGIRFIPDDVVQLGKIKDTFHMREVLELLYAQEGLNAVAVPLPKEKEYVSMFRDAGVDVKHFDFRAQALARAVVPKGDKGTYMIIDLAEKHTSVFVISGGLVRMAANMSGGENIFTKMVSEHLGTSIENAEALKREVGFKRNVEERGITTALRKGAVKIFEEVQKHLLSWHTTKDEKGKMNPKISKIMLSGSGANIAGLSDYLSVNLKTKVDVANAWVNIMDTRKTAPEMHFEDSVSYAAALGLALKHFEH